MCSIIILLLNIDQYCDLFYSPLNSVCSKFQLAIVLRWWNIRDFREKTSPLNTVISDARASEIQKCKDLPTLSNLDCSCRNPMEVRLIHESSLWLCNNIRMCEEKCTLDQRIIPLLIKFTHGPFTVSVNRLHCLSLCIVQMHPMSGKSTLLSLGIVRRPEDIQCQESLHCYHFLYCAKTSNVREVYIATFALCQGIQCQENLHCYHLVLCEDQKTSKVRKVYIAITFVLCKGIQCQESLHCYHFCIVQRCPMSESLHGYHFCIVQRHPMSKKFALLSPLYCVKTSNINQESLHCYHLCIVERHPMSGKSTLLLLLYCGKTSNVRKVYIAITFVLWKDINVRTINP